jgi:hypothetical protein
VVVVDPEAVADAVAAVRPVVEVLLALPGVEAKVRVAGVVEAGAAMLVEVENQGSDGRELVLNVFQRFRNTVFFSSFSTNDLECFLWSKASNFFLRFEFGEDSKEVNASMFLFSNVSRSNFLRCSYHYSAV